MPEAESGGAEYVPLPDLIKQIFCGAAEFLQHVASYLYLMGTSSSMGKVSRSTSQQSQGWFSHEVMVIKTLTFGPLYPLERS